MTPLARSTTTVVQSTLTPAAMAAALFYSHPDATAVTALHCFVTYRDACAVRFLAATIAALRGYRIQDKARATELIALLAEVTRRQLAGEARR